MQNPNQCNSQPRLAVLHVIDSGFSNKEPDLKPFGVGLSRPCYVADTRNAQLGADAFALSFGRGSMEVIPEGNPGAGGNYQTLGVNGQAFDENMMSAAFPTGTVNQIDYKNAGNHPYHRKLYNSSQLNKVFNKHLFLPVLPISSSSLTQSQTHTHMHTHICINKIL